MRGEVEEVRLALLFCGAAFPKLAARMRITSPPQPTAKLRAPHEPAIVSR